MEGVVRLFMLTRDYELDGPRFPEALGVAAGESGGSEARWAPDCFCLPMCQPRVPSMATFQMRARFDDARVRD